MAKRGHKMHEFVAHASSVSCLSIGKKSCRLLVTGGEDHKVNLWAIGKPNFLMSLSGHTSPVESVNFDSGEVLVAAGASTGAIKLWDFEEAKIVRTLTGHRSNCTAVEFHPFGEFFASGSSDTNLKIWDIRKKGCIHTYKGHNRGISTIKFTPDGRWVVSGGLDNLVKVWDLTAGKLLHDFKFHEGKIRCIDFHPLEFLLATGSADRTVKFWDLETFELIGSTEPESAGICSMIFHPDGRTLFCGLDDSLKVFSWEPIICHDAVDMGWSTLSDLCIHEEKLLGCSYHQNRVGVWVADISFIGPYGSGSSPMSKGLTEKKFSLQENPIDRAGSNIKSNSGLTTMSQDDETKEIKNIYVDSGNASCVSPRRFGPVNTPEVALPFDYSESANPSLKKSPPKEVHTRSKSRAITRTFNAPDIVPINNPKGDGTASARRESLTTERISPHMLLKQTHIMRPSNIKCEAERLPTTAEPTSFSSKLSNSEIGSDIVAKPTHIQRSSNSKYDLERLSRTVETGSLSGKSIELTSVVFPDFHNRLIKKDEARETCDENNSNFKSVTKKLEKILPPQPPATQENSGDLVDCSKEVSSARIVNGVVPGRTRSLVERWEQRERFSNDEAPTTIPSDVATKTDTSPSMVKRLPQTSGRESVSATDEDVNEYLMQSHDVLLSTLRSRLTKLQVVRHFWERNEIKGAINAMRKFPDHSVQADVIGVLSEKMEIITLDLFSCLLPVLEGLLDSKTDRHVSVSLDILVKLGTIFGPVIRSTLSTSPSVGIDLQAELRHQCCEQCFIALQKINLLLPSLTRRGGLLANSAQELSLILQEP